MRYTTGREAIQKIIGNLQQLGYQVVGPSLSEGVVRLSRISKSDDLASGVVDTQGPGTYQVHDSSPLVFSAVNGPDSPKCYLHPSGVELVRLIERRGETEVLSSFHTDRKYAFFGLRPCDLAAVQVLDRAMMSQGFEDSVYTSFRRNCAFIVVNCTRAGANCFCASMGTGPSAKSGFDLAITELSDKLLIDVPQGSENLLRGVDLNPVSEDDLRREADMLLLAKEQMGKRIDRESLSSRMFESIDSPAWGEVAERCLACGNCTLVCPTCFCNSTLERIDLTDDSVSRVRVWDSCLSRNFVYAAGWNPRHLRRDRYRQFVMHKFSYWLDQFGTYGCVGCGRCITWCPVGIDITRTLNDVLSRPGAVPERPKGVQIA